MYGNKEENRIEGENRIKELYVEERGRRGKESDVEMEIDEGQNENRMREDDMERNEWEE